MCVPSYLVDQEIEYIQARGFTFRDFSSEQVINELHSHDIYSADDYKQYQKKPTVTLADNGLTYSNISAIRYEQLGYSLKKSSSLVGGWFYHKAQ